MGVYEVGYHIIPTLPEEEVPQQVAAIREMIEERGCIFIAEEFPKMRGLTFAVSKRAAGTRGKFTHAYFGWLKFDLLSSQAVALQRALEANEKIIRFLLIETVRENTLVSTKVLKKNSDNGEEKKVGTAEEPRKEVSQEELDKSIEKLVGETASVSSPKAVE